jgi:uncharacterized membrane protein YcjF (UPF0283 family)
MAIFTCVLVFLYLKSVLRCLFLRCRILQAESTKKTRRITEQEQNTDGKHAECNHVKKKATNQKKQRSRILKHMKIKYPTQLKMAM